MTTASGTNPGDPGEPVVRFGDPLPVKDVGPPVVVSGASPKKVPAEGGPEVVITGTGFTGATAVAFGSSSVKVAARFKVDSDTQITATAPDSTKAFTPSSDLTIYVTTASGTNPGNPGEPVVRFGDPRGAKLEREAGSDETYDAAIKTGQWTEAARALEKFTTDEIKERLGKLKPAQVKKLRKAALDDSSLGPQSMVAILAEPAAKKAAGTSDDEPDPRADGVSAAGEGPPRADADKQAGDSLSTKEVTPTDRDKQTSDAATKAAGKAVEAALKQFLKTSRGKEIQKAAEGEFDKIPSSLPYIVGAALVGGAIIGLAKTHGEPPITESPDIPLPDLGQVKLTGKITWEGPVDKPTKTEVMFTFEIPLGKRDPEKSPKSDADKVAEDKRKLEADHDARQKKEPDDLPKISGDPAPTLPKGKGSTTLLDAFDVSRLKGKPMNLNAMAKKLKPISDGTTGRLRVVAFWGEPVGDDKDAVAKGEERNRNRAAASARKTVAALQEFFKPKFEGRIDLVVANSREDPVGFSSADTTAVGTHEVAVVFMP